MNKSKRIITPSPRVALLGLMMAGQKGEANMKYRVWMHGSSMTASYDGYVDVIADNEEEAVHRAKRELTKPTGTFSDWSPSMFKVDRIENKGV